MKQATVDLFVSGLKRAGIDFIATLPFTQAARLLPALAREPGNLAARDGLGRALAAQNKPREAAEQFQAIIAAEPRNAFAQVSLATMLLQLGRAPEAVTHYETAIRLGLDSPAIRAALAQAREAAGAR